MKKKLSEKRSMALWMAGCIAVILFAGWYFTRTYFIAAYSLPTRSMEKTIHVGGKVMVTKQNYGPISRGDILVFHFPEGDTVIDLPEYQSLRPYYEVIRDLGRGDPDAGRRIVLADPTSYPLSIRPVDKREIYLKRCIATPGDTVAMRDELLYIDGRRQAWPPGAETYFQVVTSGQPFDKAAMKAQYDLDLSNPDEIRSIDNASTYEMLLTWKASEKMLKDGFARRITPDIDSSTGGVFPNDDRHPWTRDNYGPLWVPKKGAAIALTPLNYPVYERIIRTYEGNQLDIRGGRIYLNGHEEASYTFQMNYYWMIGDNLHGSQDSRYWGFVPEDHLIGKVTRVL
jgi:signal peptidase I